jgi:pimeloyl-ACP methyl ester carboxylesterase
MVKKISLLLIFVFLLSACSAAAPTPDPTTGSEPDQVEPSPAETEETAPEQATAEPTPEPPAQQNLPIVGAAEAYPDPPTPVVSISGGAYPEANETQAVEAEPVENPAACDDAFQFSPNYTVTMQDGLQISGDLYMPTADAPLPGVLLLHMMSTDRTVWGNFPEELAKACYTVLNVDLRGHGQTGGEVDWEQAQLDIPQILQALGEMEGVNPESLAILGASIGANLALTGGADVPAVRTVVLLSPGLDYAGVTTLDAMERYGERPVLIAVSDQDTYAADSSRQLADAALGEFDLIVYEGTAHGRDMFNSQSGLQQIILDWLASYLP